MGADDAVAFLLCLQQPQLDILAVTAVHGNSHVDQVCVNVATCLRNMERDIPIYKGCSQDLLRPWAQGTWPGHGSDGLGDSKSLFRDNIASPQKEHAAMAIVNLVRANPNEVELLVIGPCTNVALALKLDPELPNLIKKIWVMGGTSEGKGNIVCASEFNFHCDPEAANIMFKAFEVDKSVEPKLTLYPWEQCCNHSLSWDFFDGLVGRKDKPATLAGFVLGEVAGAIERTTRILGKDSFYSEEQNAKFQFIACDSFAAAVMIDDSITKEIQTLHITVETAGNLTAGTTVIDWYERHSENRNCRLVLDLD